MWLIAEFQPTALFSLKPAWATSSGGKSLLVPTPYAFKMALLDAVCRADGAAHARAMWPTLRDLTMALRPPDRLVVTNLFAKILKPRRRPAGPGSEHAGPLGQTIAYREYVHFSGPLGVALAGGGTNAGHLAGWLLHVNYLGKRGGFAQLLRAPQFSEVLPPGFVLVNGGTQVAFPVDGIIQQLDDCGPSLTFDQASIYSGKRVTMGRDRVLHHVVLPYRLTSSSKSFSCYERIQGCGR